MTLAVDVGDKIKVLTKILPTDDMDIESEDLPEYLEGEVVSIRKNTNGWFFKVKVYTKWLRDAYDCERGRYVESYIGYRYFTYPMCAIGRTVHTTKKGGGSDA